MIQGVVAFAGVAIVGAIRGVLIAVAVSLVTIFAKGWRPHITTLARVDGFKGYHDIDRHPEGRSKVMCARFSNGPGWSSR